MARKSLSYASRIKAIDSMFTRCVDTQCCWWYHRLCVCVEVSVMIMSHFHPVSSNKFVVVGFEWFPCNLNAVDVRSRFGCGSIVVDHKEISTCAYFQLRRKTSSSSKQSKNHQRASWWESFVFSACGAYWAWLAFTPISPHPIKQLTKM